MELHVDRDIQWFTVKRGDQLNDRITESTERWLNPTSRDSVTLRLDKIGSGVSATLHYLRGGEWVVVSLTGKSWWSLCDEILRFTESDYAKQP